MATLLYDQWVHVSYYVDRRMSTAIEAKQADLLIALATDHVRAANNLGG